MPAAIPIVAAVATAAAVGGTAYSMVSANQQKQHAIGAAQAQNDAANAQINQEQAQDKATQQQKAQSASATQQAALAAIRASMGTSGSMGGTILTGPQGAAAAPTQGKTLLGL